jgi:hypothetical protein
LTDGNLPARPNATTIHPDIAVEKSVADVVAGDDPVMATAVSLATGAGVPNDTRPAPDEKE